MSSAGATKYESRAVSVTKTSGSGLTVELDGKLTSTERRLPRRRHGAARPAPPERDVGHDPQLTHDRERPVLVDVVGFKAKARIVVPQVTKTGLVCAPVTLGFDRGYLSPG